MRFSKLTFILSTALTLSSVSGWYIPTTISSKNAVTSRTFRPSISNFERPLRQHDDVKLFVSPASSEQASSGSSSSTDDDDDDGSPFTQEEIQFLQNSFPESMLEDSKLLQEELSKTLPKMHPNLVIKLKTAQNDTNSMIQTISIALNAIMDQQLQMAKDTLKTLLEAGEIRKLDALIGKAAREGKLDAAFFTVLNMNLQDAQNSDDEEPANNQQFEVNPEATAESSDGEQQQPPSANRAQILQHVYTRCQEEVEKTVPPGIALLNKLLRTEQDAIRANQLQHYLCPQPNTITSPDGKVIELNNGEPRVLVPPTQLVDAIAQAIKQIRTVEKAGGTDRVAAAGMVESVRQVAKEARLIIGQEYGVDSETLKEFENGLQPVFRPESPDSPYIKGV